MLTSNNAGPLVHGVTRGRDRRSMFNQIEETATEIGRLRNHAAKIDDLVARNIVVRMADVLTLMLEDFLDGDDVLRGSMPWWTTRKDN